MAFTKITAAGIGTTESVTLDGLSVINNGSFGGNLTVGGVLTYEDVTNVDSVGLITARNGIVVGSGITLSKDGDGFFTGVVTATSYNGDGSNLTGIDLSAVTGATGDFSIADKIVHTGDTNTAIRFPSADTITAETSGTESFRIDSSGNVNFGAEAANTAIQASGPFSGATPKLEVKLGGASNSYTRLVNIANPSGATGSESLGRVGIKLALGNETNSTETAKAGIIYAESTSTFNNAVSLCLATNNTERFRIESDGDFRLSSGDAGTNYAFIRGWQSSTGDMIIGADQSATGTNGSNLIFRTRGSEKVRIENHGTLKIGNNLSVTGIATVGSAVTISESGIEASGIGITVANINGSSTGSKNLIINGAMNVAQYDLSEGNGTKTTSSGHLCDRWKIQQGGVDENARMEHIDVGSSDTGPYEEGFRKSLKIQNGNQTSGAGAADFMELYQYIEGDQVLTSGWDYKNPNSKLTISFWVKSTIAQTFPGFFYTTSNGSSVHYMYDYVIGNGTSNLTANTWTKIKHTIPGNSNLVVTAGTGYGLGVGIFPFQGTDYTTSRSASNAWASWTTSNKVPDMTTTWYTTNNAQLYITGVQLEVGEEATPYKHKHIAEEQIMCKRYYQVIAPSAADHMMFGFGRAEGNTARIGISVPVPMRAVPTVICSNNRAVKYDSTMTQSTTTPSVYNSGSVDLDSNIMTIDFGGHSSLTHNNVYIVTSDSGGSLQLSAEL